MACWRAECLPLDSSIRFHHDFRAVHTTDQASSPPKIEVSMTVSFTGAISAFEFTNGRFSFVGVGSNAGIGWSNFSFHLNGISSTGLDWQQIGRSRPHRLTMTAAMPGFPVVQTLEFNHDPDRALLTVKRTLRAKEDFELRNIRDGMLEPGAAVVLPAGHYHLRFCHSANIRTEVFPASRPEYPYVRRPEYGPHQYNIGEANDIPAYYLCTHGYHLGMVEAELREDTLKRVWHMEIDPDMCMARYLTFYAEQRLLGADRLILAKGEDLCLSETMYQLLQNTHPQHAFDTFIDVFASLYPAACGRTSPMLNGACYCTWNYGPEQNVHEPELLERARIIRKNFPAVNFFLLDDGYEREPRVGNAPISHFYPNPARNYNPARFPNGMRKFADRIRKIGLQPAIWMSPMVRFDSALATDHPGWLLRRRDGTVLKIGEGGYLDLSVPAARQWIDSVLQTLFVTWGFRGLKMDFQSHMFESVDACCREGTLVQWRHWFYSRIRELLGPDGFFETCIAMTMGNPHLSRYADAYRLGGDVGENFLRHKDCASHSLASLPIPGHKTMLLNMDSFGMGTHYTWDEFESRMAWCFITQGVLEFGGQLEKYDGKQLNAMAHILAHPDRGHGCRVVDQGCYTGEPFPAVVIVDYPDTSTTRRRGISQHIALFNWTDQPAMVGATPTQLGLAPDHTVTDFWSDKPQALRPEGLFEFLRPHACRLLTVRT
jgi:hypothetical protein